MAQINSFANGIWHAIAKIGVKGILVFSAIFFVSYHSVSQTNTWDGSASANWNTAANWSLNLVPTAAHDVVIPDGITTTITVNTAAVCASFTMNDGGNNCTVTVSAGNSLTVSNAVDVGTGTGGFGVVEKTLAINTGTLTCGSITLADAGFNKTSRVTASTGTINVSGNIDMPDPGFAATVAIQFTGAGTLNLSGTMTGGDYVSNASTLNIVGDMIGVGFDEGTGTVDYMGNNQTIRSEYTYNNLIFSGAGDASSDGDITIGGDFTINTVGTLDFGAFTYDIGGDWINDAGTLDLTSSTINLNGAGQTIGGTNSTTFNNLRLSGSGTKTFSFSTTIDATLSIDGVVANLGAFTSHTTNALAFDNVGQVSGTWGSTSSAAANTNDTYFAATAGVITAAVDGPTTFYSRQTGNWSDATTWSTVTYGDATNTSGTFPQSGDIVNIGNAAVTITVDANSDCGIISFLENVNVSATLTINTGITLDVTETINIPRTSVFSGEINTLAVGDGTLNANNIDFSGGGFIGQNQLTIAGGTATVTGDISADGLFASTADIIFTDTGVLQLAGSFLTSLEATLTAGTGTMIYAGSDAQAIGDFTYNNLILSGSGAKSVIGAIDVDGSILIGSGTPFNTGTFTHTISGDWLNSGGTIDNSNSTISFDGGTPTIGGSAATDFKNLTIDASTTTFNFVTDITATLAIQNGGVANFGSITTHTAKTLSLDGVGQTPGTWGSTSSAAAFTNDTYFSAGTTGFVTATNTIYYSRQTGDWNNSMSWSTVAFGDATNAGTFPLTGDIARIGGNVTITVTADAECSFVEYETGAGNTNNVTINTGNTLDATDAVIIASLNGDTNTMNVGAGTLNTPSLVFNPEFAGTANSELTISTGTASISGDVSHIGDDFFGFKQVAFITFSGAGTLEVAGNFLTSDDCDMTASTGTISYIGTSPQTVADFTYYNLTFNNTSSSIPDLTLADNVTVTNELNMTAGVLDIAGFTLTLGNAGASTLSRTPSTTTNWVYGGTITRFWPASTAVTSSSGNYYGLFPVGTSESSSYRPVELNSTVSQTGAGSLSVLHTDFAGNTELSPFYDDGGTDIEIKDNSNFVITNTATGGTYDVSITMTGFGVGTLDNYRLGISDGGTTVTTVGTHAAATGSTSTPTANRTDVTSAELDGDWRITSIDKDDTPLPVELLSFAGQFQDNYVAINWSTASETDNDYFELERSKDGISYQTIAIIEGKGTTTHTQHYGYEDRGFQNGTNYYRLKQVDFDGQFEIFQAIVVHALSGEQLGLTIFPNPAQSELHININGGNIQGNSTVFILDYAGRKVYERKIAMSSNSIILDNLDFYLKPGLYFVLVKSGNSTMQSKLIFRP